MVIEKESLEDQVNKLIQITYGGIKKSWRQRHWYTLGLEITHVEKYNPEEQFDAVRRLGETNSQSALKYLEILILNLTAEPEYTFKPDISDPSSYSGDSDTGQMICTNAPGEFERAMGSQIHVIYEAIAKLKTSLKIEK